MKSDECEATRPLFIPEAIYVNEVMTYLDPVDLLDCRVVSRANKVHVHGKYST